MTRQEQIEEMLGTIGIVLWDEDYEEIASVRNWLEDELKEEKENINFRCGNYGNRLFISLF